MLHFKVCNAYSQPRQHSDLYLRVDSIIRYQLKFNIDSAELINKKKLGNAQWPVNNQHVRSSSLVLLLNSRLVNRSELDAYPLSSVKSLIKTKRELITEPYGSIMTTHIISINTEK
jgi:hypothetical protein